MNAIFFKKLEDNYLQICFLNNSSTHLFFDSWNFTFEKEENINLEDFTRLESIEDDFEILEIRSHNDDVFYVLLNDLTIIQISSSPNMDNEIEQNIYIFKSENSNYASTQQRFNNSKTFNLE